MSRYSIDTDQNSCLDTNEDQKCNLDTVQAQKSMNDGPVLKLKIRDVSNDPLTRERLIKAPKEDHGLALVTLFQVSLSRGGRKGSCSLFHERQSIDA